MDSNQKLKCYCKNILKGNIRFSDPQSILLIRRIVPILKRISALSDSDSDVLKRLLISPFNYVIPFEVLKNRQGKFINKSKSKSNAVRHEKN